MALSLSMSKAQFSEYLLDYYGIEGNTFAIADAVMSASKVAASTWNDYCAAWQQAPEEDLIGLRTKLKAIGAIPEPAAPAPKPKHELSPGTKSKLAEIDKLGAAGEPIMFDERLGPRVGKGRGKTIDKATTPFDLKALKPPPTGSSMTETSRGAKKKIWANEKAEAEAAAEARLPRNDYPDALRYAYPVTRLRS